MRLRVIKRQSGQNRAQQKEAREEKYFMKREIQLRLTDKNIKVQPRKDK